MVLNIYKIVYNSKMGLILQVVKFVIMDILHFQIEILLLINENVGKFLIKYKIVLNLNLIMVY